MEDSRFSREEAKFNTYSICIKQKLTLYVQCNFPGKEVWMKPLDPLVHRVQNKLIILLCMERSEGINHTKDAWRAQDALSG